jgi:hypothetical protein
VELAATGRSSSSGGLSLAAISAVFTIGYVANLLGEDEDWLFDLAGDMFPEDGCLWSMASARTACLPRVKASNACSRSSPTKEPPAAHRRRSNRPNNPACGFHRMLTRIRGRRAFMRSTHSADAGRLLHHSFPELARREIIQGAKGWTLL